MLREFAAARRAATQKRDAQIVTAAIDGTARSGAPAGMPLFLQPVSRGTLQRCGATPCSCDHDGGGVPSIVHEVLRTRGEPLDAATRGQFEPRFGHDFGDVRVHADERAARAADAVHANAFTVGNSIVFGRGMYEPRSSSGQRLLGHELAHAVQQGGDAPTARSLEAGNSASEREAHAVADAVTAGDAASLGQSSTTAGVVQRDAKPTAARTDVAIVLTNEDQDMAEGHAYAGTVLRVYSAEDARDKLKALGVPIGRLYVVSHSNSAGNVQFVSSSGTISWTSISALGATLKSGLGGGNEPSSVDFRGCKLGSADTELEGFRSALGAQSAKAANCWSFTQRVTPLTYDGADVTTPGQIPKGMQSAFDQALLRQVNGLKSADGHPVKNCIIGLGPGETADAANLKKLWSLYWANNGNLLAIWASPNYNQNWQEGSTCWKDMTESTKPCSLVTKTAAAASP